MKELMKERVEDYINNDIIYLKNEISVCGYHKNELDDLHYLENITDEEIEDIVNKILNDDELNNKVNELIHYYLFH